MSDCPDCTPKPPPGKVCVLCMLRIERVDYNDVRPVGPDLAHRECLLRSVLGGIGHLENHAYWCGKMHDPDGGHSYRVSALKVDEWVHRYGVEAAQ